MKKQLWFENFTEEYMEGLPIGNGRLAAMVLGRPEKLRVGLNHEWMWRGEQRFRECQQAAEHLPELRAALLREDFLTATELAFQHFGSPGGDPQTPNRNTPYEPVGDLFLSLNIRDVCRYTSGYGTGRNRVLRLLRPGGPPGWERRRGWVGTCL